MQLSACKSSACLSPRHSDLLVKGRAIGDQPTGEPERAVEIDRRYRIPGRKPDELILPTEEERIGADRQSRARLLGDVRERRIDVAFVTGGRYARFPPASVPPPLPLSWLRL